MTESIEQPVQLKVGCRYLRADGLITKIVRKTDSELYPFMDEFKTTYTPSGEYQISSYTSKAMNIVKELIPED